MLKYLSVGGSHTNTFRRQVKAGVRSMAPSRSDENGNLNLEKLSLRRPGFHKAVVEGMPWPSLHWGCQIVWPGLPHLAQDALNVQCKNAASEGQVMLDLSLRRKLVIESGKQVQWDQLKAAACDGNPPCAPYIYQLAKFVEHHSGGIDGLLVKELESFRKMWASSDTRVARVLGGEFIGKVACLNFGNCLTSSPTSRMP